MLCQCYVIVILINQSIINIQGFRERVEKRDVLNILKTS